MRVLALLLSCFLVVVTGPLSAQDNGRPPPEVEVADPIARTIRDYDEYTGRFLARRSVTLQARVSGYLQTILFEEGDAVDAGQLLYQIDSRPFEIEVASAVASLRASIALRELAKVETERATTLMQKKVGSQQDLDRERAGLAEAEANVALAEANLRAARLNLEFTRIKAPIAGRISSTRLDIGNLVTGGTMGAAGLAEIISINPIEFTFTVSEAAYLKYLRLAGTGERASSRDFRTAVEVRLMDEDNYERQGRMTFVDNQLDPNSGTIEGRATFLNDDGFLTPGVFGKLRIAGSGQYRALLIPDTAILSDQARKIVYVIDDEGIAEARPVTRGPMYQGLRVIRNGLKEGERIVTVGVQRVQPGKPVTPKETTLSLDPAADG